MTLLDRIVRRPVLVLVIFTIVVVFGGYSLSTLPINQMPEIEPPVISVVTVYPGAGAADVESKITDILERTLSSLAGLDRMTSISRENMSMITLELDFDVDLEGTASEIRQRLGFVKGELPGEAMDSWIFKFNTAMMPVYILGVKANKGDLRAYRKLVKEKLITRIERIKGVGSVMMLNAPKRQVIVEVDRKRLQDRDLSLFRLIQILQAQNITVPAGRIKTGDLDLPVSVPGDFRTLDQIRHTLVGMGSAKPLAGAQRQDIPDPFYLALGQVYLKDVATVKIGMPDRSSIAKYGDKETMWLMVFRRSGANTVEVVDRIKKGVKTFQPYMPPGLELVTILDGSEFVRSTVDNLTNAVLYGGILVILVILIFLRRLRSSLVVIVTIPSSIVAVFMGMYVMRYTLNAVSLASIALAVGMVVDAAIVVLESITRRVEEGEPPHRAAVTGTREVAAAIMASTLTTVVIFAPLVFVRGFIGIMMGVFAFVMVFTLVASLITALVLTPTLSARLIKADDPNRSGPLRRLGRVVERGFLGVERGYGWLLGKALRARILVILIALGILGGSAWLVMRTGVDLMIKDDFGFIMATVELPEGTRVERTAEVADALAKKMRSYKEVSHTFYNAGTSEAAVMSVSGGKEGPNVANVYCRLIKKAKRPGVSENDILDRLRPWLKKHHPRAKVFFRIGNPMGMALMGAGKPITLNVKGKNFQHLKRTARQLEAMLKSIPGTKDVASELLETKPDFRIVVDRKRAAKMGLSAFAIGGTLRAALHGWKVSEYRGTDVSMDLMVRLRKKDRDSPRDLERLLIPNLAQKHVTMAGQISHGGFMKFPLGNFARIIRSRSPIEIRHMDKDRIVRVGAAYQGRALGSIMTDIKKRLKQLDLPRGITVEFGGEMKRQQETLSDLILVLIFSILLVYLVMAAQFESLLDPFVIMFSVPFALTGVFLAFLVTGSQLTLPAFIGLIVLIGVVVNNAIVLIDYVNQLRDRGMEKSEAIQAAGERRLRPVLMTAFTTIGGMLPLALATKEGAFVWSSLGRAVVGGLLVSTLVTLIVVPVMYSLFEFMRRRHRRAAWMQETSTEPEPEPG